MISYISVIGMPACRNGRRGRLKICCGQPRVGSSPTTSIDKKSEIPGKMGIFRLFYFFTLITLDNSKKYIRKKRDSWVCEENSVNNQIFYDNEMAEGSCWCFPLCFIYNSEKIVCQERRLLFACSFYQIVSYSGSRPSYIILNSP